MSSTVHKQAGDKSAREDYKNNDSSTAGALV